MVVVVPLPAPFPAPLLPPWFWMSTPRTSPLLFSTLLLLPLFTTPRFWPPTLTPLLAHCPLLVIPLIWSPEVAEVVPVALPWFSAGAAVLVRVGDPPFPPGAAACAPEVRL